MITRSLVLVVAAVSALALAASGRASTALAQAVPTAVVLPDRTERTPAAAITVADDAAEYRFAESMTFQLSASAAVPIEDVVLRYVIGRDGIRNRRIPTFTPGTRIEATHEETLVRGQIPRRRRSAGGGR